MDWHRPLAMSGTEAIDAYLDRLEAVLDRQIPIDSLSALLSSVDRKPQKNIQLENVAIGQSTMLAKRLLRKPDRQLQPCGSCQKSASRALHRSPSAPC